MIQNTQQQNIIHCHRLSVGLKLALQNIAVEIQTFGIFGNHGFMIELLETNKN